MTLQANSKVYTISELNSEVQAYLRQKYPTSIWVQGEIKNYNRNAHKQHIFFELCEKDPQGENVRARINAVIFEGVKARIAASLAKIEAGFQLQDDIEVKLECMVDLYPPSGSYQLRVLDIDPTYTLGRIAQQRYEILERLKKEELLERNKLLIVPAVPLRIGLITSYNSAAYHDFIHELKTSGFAFQVWMVDSRMQGHRVELDLCRILEFLNQREDLDVVVIIRGGGARSELAWFDSYKIGQAIAHSRYPVFTGLGHEIDLSVTDLVAHTYKKTPTAVAQYLMELVEGFLAELERVRNEILQRGEELIREARQDILDFAWAARESHNRLIRQTLLRLQTNSERIRIRSGFYIRRAQENVALWKDRFPRVIESRLKSQRHEIEVLEVRRDARDPIQVLKRGFTLSLNSQGRAIRRLSQVKVGAALTTVLMDGQLLSRVIDKRSGEKEAVLRNEEQLSLF